MAGGVPVRVYEPEDARGTIAYLHGGGWVMGNLESVDAVCRALASASRARVVSIDYRLAPEHPFPAALQDALSATRAVEADVVAGDSAGGNLAAVVARHLPAQLKLQLLVYPVTDAALNTPSYTEFDERFGLTAASMQRFWRLYLNGGDGPTPTRRRCGDDLEGSRPRTSSPPATTSCATRARPTPRRSSAQG